MLLHLGQQALNAEGLHALAYSFLDVQRRKQSEGNKVPVGRKNEVGVRQIVV